MMFGFENGFAMFDMTPVDNQFIQEYLPQASGDQVRVYLYGLMRCYHPEEDMTPGRMGKELGLTEEDVLSAYRYWERRGLVRRVSDQPVSYQYVSMRRGFLQETVAIDPAYASFSEDLIRVFDNQRQLHGQEIQTCYEWVEDLHLPREVVIMLLRHMLRMKGKGFTIRDAERLAMKLAEEDIRTVEDAEDYFSRDEAIYQGTKKVLRRLGKRNAPSQDQLALYQKWTRDWGFTPEAVEEACVEAARGDPNMGYLDGILSRLHQRMDGAARPEAPGASAAMGRKDAAAPKDERAVEAERERSAQLREVLRRLGRGMISDATNAWYDGLRADFSPELILLAAQECGRTGGNPGDVERMLRSWQQKGITETAEAERYVADFRAQSALLLDMRHKWGLNSRMGEKDRALLNTWEKELGFTPEMILHTADYAAGSEKPMAYLDTILRDYAARNIRTTEAAERDRQARREAAAAGEQRKKDDLLPAQRYTQRDYSHEEEDPEELMARLNRGVIHGA